MWILLVEVFISRVSLTPIVVFLLIDLSLQRAFIHYLLIFFQCTINRSLDCTYRKNMAEMYNRYISVLDSPRNPSRASRELPDPFFSLDFQEILQVMQLFVVASSATMHL